jgi:peroxiredoxin Q/BCP
LEVLRERVSIHQESVTMRTRGRFGLAVGAVTLLALACSQALSAGGAKVGDKAPAVEAVDEQGKPWKLSDHLGKKIVVIYFFPAALTGG